MGNCISYEQDDDIVFMEESIQISRDRYQLTDFEMRKLQHCIDVYVYLLQSGYSKEHAAKIFETQLLYEARHIRVRVTQDVAILNYYKHG